MILANLSVLQSGMEQAELTGYDGSSSLVLMDPKRTPSGNAEHYFKRYKKAKSGRDIILKRVNQAEGELSFLRKLQSDIDDVQDLAGLLSLKSKITEFGMFKTGSQEKQQKPASAEASSFYRKIDYQGWEILVGKSAAGNDFISTKMAGQDDLWLHAEGMPGSHVLIRNPEHKDIPSEVFAKAASLAGFYSKGRNAGKVSITYTAARFVRKPKGAKPGLVALLERKSVMAVPRQE
jgi:predicted ribosome quality control (RQC) complex YloA/Tae2 family protein